MDTTALQNASSMFDNQCSLGVTVEVVWDNDGPFKYPHLELALGQRDSGLESGVKIFTKEFKPCREFEDAMRELMKDGVNGKLLIQCLAPAILEKWQMIEHRPDYLEARKNYEPQKRG